MSIAPVKSGVVTFNCTEIFSHVTEHPFVLFYVTEKSTPQYLTVTPSCGPVSFQLDGSVKSLGLVGQMYCRRQNDENKSVSHFLGSIVVDLSQVKDQEYSFVVRDCSNRKPIRTGQISMSIDLSGDLSLQHLEYQRPDFSRKMYSAADANLTWIEGFSPKGLKPIVQGLKCCVFGRLVILQYQKKIV